MEQTEDQMNLIMGIGPVLNVAPDIKKTLRVGTIKQIKEVGELYKGGLLRMKSALYREDQEREENIIKWVEILNIVLIEGFTREEFDDSIPELMESAVDRFLFS